MKSGKTGIVRRLTATMMIAAMMVTSTFAAIDKYKFDVKVPEYTPSTVSFSKAPAIESYAKGSLLPSQGYYSDASRAGIGKSVARLTAVGAIDRKSSSYRPYSNPTGYESLEMILGMTGQKEAIKASAAGKSAGWKSDKAKALLLREYFLRAKASGMVLPSEEKYLNRSVPRYLFAAWLARAAGVQPQVPVENGLMSFADDSSIPETYRPLLEGLYEKDVIRGGSSGLFDPMASVSKLDGTVMMDRLLPDFYGALGISEDTGLVMGKRTSASTKAGVRTTTRSIFINRADGSLGRIKAVSRSTSRTGTDFIYYSNGKITGSSGVATGSELKMLLKDGKVVFAERTTGNSIFSSLGKKALEGEGLEFNYGRVVNRKAQSFYEGGRKYSTSRVRIENYDGEVMDVIVKNKAQLSIANSLLIIKNDVPKSLDALAVGDFLEYYTKPEGEIVFAKVKKATNSQIKGEITEIRTDTTAGLKVVTVYDSGGRIQNWPVAEYALFSFGGAPAFPRDLEVGQSVVMNVYNDFITSGYIDGFENSNYIPPQSKMRTGSVIKANQSQITVAEDFSSRTTYSHNVVETVILKGGSPIPYSRVKPGDKVKLYFDTVSSTTPSKIEVESVSTPVKQIYRGTIYGVDEGTGMLSLRSAKYLDGTRWKDDSYVKEFEVSPKVSVYSGTQRIGAERLTSDFKGRTAYIAVEDSYGSDSAVQIVVSGGHESMYYDKVDSIDKTFGQMELANNANIGLSDSTIVVRDGRIIPYDLIDDDSDVLVVADSSSGAMNASVVKVVPKGYEYFGGIWFGAVESVDPSSFRVRYYTSVSGNSFAPVVTSVSKMFSMSSDTSMYDFTADKQIDSGDLFNGAYPAIDNYETPPAAGLSQKHYYGFFTVGPDNHVEVLGLRKSEIIKGTNIDDSSLTEAALQEKISAVMSNAVFTRGTAGTSDATWSRLEVKSSSDYRKADGSWRMNPTSVWIRYDSALIIKGGEAVKPDSIAEGDQLSIIRYGENGLVIKVDDQD